MSTKKITAIEGEDPSLANRSMLSHPAWYNLKYLAVGMVFGTILVKAEIVSWLRIQEMFRMQSFHMYGIIGSAVITAMIGVLLIKKLKLRTIHGEEVVIPKKVFHWGQPIGGLVFGLGWAITGACPGPLFAQLATGSLAVGITLLSAVAGTWVYGLLREKLPH